MPSGSLIGATLSHFRVTGLLGAGGMGEVYRAEDTALRREVAIKVLPPAFVADGERVTRFEREARTLASLSHPNIGAIHEVGHEDGTHFLVLELVPGETLADRLARGPLPLDEALPIALQIAAALEAAHERGVVHRDLKPGNVMVDEDGRVKVLDFGLAKALSADAASASGGAADPRSPTLTYAATQAGVLLGTAAYMSPEQARGKSADTRADVWAFGVVLWEMLTGRHLFAGETVSDVLAAILRQELDARELPADTPASVRRVLRLCLQRDPRQRLRHIGDAALLLAPGEEAPAAAGAPPVGARRSTLPWVAAAGLAAAAALLGWLWWRERDAPAARLLISEITAPPGATLRLEDGLALSPDGRLVVFAARDSEGKQRLWLRPLNSSTASALAGTEGGVYPFWSPDSQHIAFFSGGRLRRLPAAGGPPQSLCDVEDARGGTWGRSGEIVFAPSWRGGLAAIAASGGERRELTSLTAGADVVSHRWPWFLPDGRRLLFLAQMADAITPGDRSTIELLDLESGEHRTLVEANSSMAWSPTGHLLYLRDGSLLAQPLDPDSGRTTGDYLPLVEDVALSGNELAGFAIDEKGTLLYAPNPNVARSSQMVWVDRAGKRLGEITGPGRYYQPALSPDGTRLAYGLDNDLWIHDLASGNASRFTFDDLQDVSPVWSPDGRWLAYTSWPGRGASVLYRRPSSGLGEAEELLRLTVAGVTAAWGPDGSQLHFIRFESGRDFDIWRLDLETRKAAVVLSTPALEADPALSPNGRWLAYGSNESARFELYVRPTAGGGGRWQISREGGEQPRWSRDGRTLYFLAADGSIMATEVEAGETFRAGLAVRLFSTPVPIDDVSDYDLHPQGDRFVVNWPLSSLAQRAMLVQEWPRLLTAAGGG